MRKSTAGMAAGLVGGIAVAAKSVLVRTDMSVARARGMAYRLLRRHPDPNVPDDVLADRIRSSVGPMEKALKIPRVNITVEHGVAILHGVASSADAEKLEKAVRRVSGVKDVTSHLSG